MQTCRYCKTPTKPFKKLYKQLLNFVQVKVPSVTEKDLFCEKCFMSLENRYKKFKEYKKKLRESNTNSLTSHSAETTRSSEQPGIIASSQELESQTQGFKSFKSFSVSSSSVTSDSSPNKLGSSNSSNLPNAPKRPNVAQIQHSTAQSKLTVDSNKKIVPIIPRREAFEEPVVSSSSSSTSVKVTTKAIVHSTTPAHSNRSNARNMTKNPNVTTRIKGSSVGPVRLAGEHTNKVMAIIPRKEVPEQPIVDDLSDMEEVEYDMSDDDIIDPAIPLPSIQPHIKRRKVLRSKNEPLNWSYKTGG